MLRKLAIVLILLSINILGCEKEEPEAPAPPVRVRRTIATPQGMAVLSQEPITFISSKPVTVGQYLAFLQATGRPAPPRWQDVRPGSPEAGAWASGLDRSQAERCAVWSMARLPTAGEWAAAREIVGPRPYPWGADPATDQARGELFLVQDWLPNSIGEQRARQRKAELEAAVLAEHQAEVTALADELAARLPEERDRRRRLRDSVATRFFGLLELEKRAAELRAQQSWSARLLEVAKNLGLEKGMVAVTAKTEAPGSQELQSAVADYQQHLTEALNAARRISQSLQGETRQLHDQVMALTATFQQVAGQEAGDDFGAAEAALAQAAAPAADVPQAMAIKEELRAALAELDRLPGPLAALPPADDLEARTAELRREIESLSARQLPTAELDEIRQKMGRFGKNIQRDFLDESLLFEELAELVELRARKEGVEARLLLLKETLGQEPGAGA